MSIVNYENGIKIQKNMHCCLHSVPQLLAFWNNHKFLKDLLAKLLHLTINQINAKFMNPKICSVDNIIW